MASSATGLSDLNKSGRPSKKEVTDRNDQCVGGELTAMTNQGTKTLNLDPKTGVGASSGDIGQEPKKTGKKTRKQSCSDYHNKQKMMLEHYKQILPESKTGVGASSGDIGQEPKKSGKNTRKESWIDYHNKQKMKLEHYEQILAVFEKVKQKNKLLWKNNMILRKTSGSTNQRMQSYAKTMEELGSQVSSLISGHISQTNLTNSLVLELLKEQKEKDKLKREIEHLKNPNTQQQLVDSSFCGHFHNKRGASQPMPIGGRGNVSQQQHVNSSLSGQIQNIHGHSQPVPAGGGGSGSHLFLQQRHVNSTFSGQFQSIPGHSQPMSTGGGGSVSSFIPQQHVNSSFSGQFMTGTSQPMQTGRGESVNPFICQEKVMGFSDDGMFVSPPPMETGGGETYPTSGN